MKFSTAEVANATGGHLVGPDAVVDGATQDSRSIRAGQLFVPLVAERDGHDFITGALASGAAAYITHRGAIGGTAIVVDDTMEALRSLASASRDRLEGPVVAITGSVGKTSTKDLLASALRKTMATHASERSFNNEIGVPLTLLNAPDGTQAAVIEMGARGIGHVASLCEIARPTIGIVTIVAAVHTGEFGSVHAIATAKGEIIEDLPSDGLAVLNGDNTYVREMAPRTSAEVLTFGRGAGCDVQVTEVTVTDDLQATFTIATDWGQVVARPSTRGAHMAANVAAAVGTSLWLGVSVEAVEAGLREAPLSPWRMDVGRTRGGALVINDAYNANPTSMLGALDSLAHLQQPRKIAVVGYMGELGASEADDHRRIADRIREIGAEMIPVGTDLYGAEPAADPIAAILERGSLSSGTAILVKGSRSAGLEVVAQNLVDL